MLQLISTFLAAIAGLASIVIAALAYKFSRQQARESWLRTYKELHETFWSEPDFRKIRAWLACQSSYSTIQPILVKRQLIDSGFKPAETLSEDEYEVLEKLDRFLNFLLRVIVINPEFKRRKDLGNRLYFQYWLERFYDSSRPELRWYFGKFYEDIYNALGVLPPKKEEVSKLPAKDEQQHNTQNSSQKP